jgi:excisionase family DNA binding protein
MNSETPVLALRIDAAAEAIGCSRCTVYRLIRRGAFGKLPRLSPGGAVRIPIDRIRAFLRGEKP